MKEKNFITCDDTEIYCGLCKLPTGAVVKMESLLDLSFALCVLEEILYRSMRYSIPFMRYLRC